MSDENGGAKNDTVSRIPHRAADPAAQIASAFREYNSSKNGLSSDEAKRRLAQYGPNALEDQTESKWHKLLLYFWGPFPFLIEAAAVISALRQDWPDLPSSPDCCSTTPSSAFGRTTKRQMHSRR